MPKNKKPIEPTRTRRQASKEALKQLQLLLDDEEDDAFIIQKEEDAKKDIRSEPPPSKKRAISPVIIESPPPKKKYKLSHRKSSDGNDRDVIVLKSISNSHYAPKENTLELECFIEELSEIQRERIKKAELEEKELQAKIGSLLKNKKAEVVFSGGISSAVEINEIVVDDGNRYFFNPNELPQLEEIEEPLTSTFQLVMDPRLGIIIGNADKSENPVQIPSAAAKGKLQIASAVKAVATLPPSNSPPPSRNMRTRRSLISTSTAPIQNRTNNTPPSRLNNIGVITRGNSNTPRSNNLSNRGISPMQTSSLPVQTRGMKSTPTIQTRNNKGIPPSGKRTIVNIPAEKPKQVVDLTYEENRNQVDNREIAFNKLQGKTYPSLVVVARPHLRVTDLAADRSKLDSKVKSVLMHPPTKFTEWLIQQGVIRSEQKCPVHSNTHLKLGMYSDAAKFPFSGGYVWISECCPQRFVSVFNGSIFEGSPHPPSVMLKLIYHWSCQTNIQNVTQWVKVDNLYVKGVYTWFRGICTLAVQSRLPQLGGPGVRIEVGVISLGTTSHDGNQRQVKVEVLGVMESDTKYVRLRAVEPMPDGDRNFRKKFLKILEPILQWVHPASTIVTDLTVDKVTLNQMGFSNVVQTTSNDYSQSNRTIMEYLRRIVPRMFQNTLSLLSRQIIQQFLDELVWREWFGITSQLAFDNILAHLAEQTRLNPQTPLVMKLNKVAANPFKSWGNGNVKHMLPSNDSAPAVPPVQAPSTSTMTPAKTSVADVVKKYGRGKKSNSPQVQVVQERPNKPVSPDVPEQMVPLENYYYGTIDPVEKVTDKVILNMKCPFCKSNFDNNILLQNHLFKHAHNVSNDVYLCRYCLTSVSTANELITHVNKSHPCGTKFEYGFVCLICEIHYMNPFVLGKHMSKEHIPHELPYQCGSCSYRCSNHKQVIDHFYMRHDGGSTIQCPFCLKSTTVWSGGRNVSQNIHYFIQHLQKHQKKQFAKKCGKCNLWYVQKEFLKEHQQKMHISLRGKTGLIPYPSPRNGVMVPKSKMDKNPCDAEVINFASLYYNISSDSVCKECNQAITSSKHFPSFDNCQNPNCQYSTCCAIAMMTHNAKCKGLNSVIAPESLPFEMFCVCGFRDFDGNAMAKHLALCEKKSAYPSEAEAKSATVMHSMLDILGLVRKPEENKNDKSSPALKIDEKTEFKEKFFEQVTQDEINVSNYEEGIERNIEANESLQVMQTSSKFSDGVCTVEDEDCFEKLSNNKGNETVQDEKIIEQKMDKNIDIIELDKEDGIEEMSSEFSEGYRNLEKNLDDDSSSVGRESVGTKTVIIEELTEQKSSDTFNIDTNKKISIEADVSVIDEYSTENKVQDKIENEDEHRELSEETQTICIEEQEIIENQTEDKNNDTDDLIRPVSASVTSENNEAELIENKMEKVEEIGFDHEKNENKLIDEKNNIDDSADTPYDQEVQRVSVERENENLDVVENHSYRDLIEIPTSDLGKEVVSTDSIDEEIQLENNSLSQQSKPELRIEKDSENYSSSIHEASEILIDEISSKETLEGKTTLISSIQSVESTDNEINSVTTSPLLSEVTELNENESYSMDCKKKSSGDEAKNIKGQTSVEPFEKNDNLEDNSVETKLSNQFADETTVDTE